MRMKPVLWIEGIIGAGKTTLANQLADMLHMRAIHEPVEANPYLKLFYEDPKRWAWSMQMHLLGHRYGLQKLAVSEAMVGETYNGAYFRPRFAWGPRLLPHAYDGRQYS